jgi:hypothetical protein
LISFTKKAWLEQRRLLRLIRNGTSRPGRKLRDFSPGLFLGDADVVGALQVKPELRTRAEPMPEMSHRFERSPLFRRTSPLGDMQKLTKRIGTECMSDDASLVARPCAIKHAAYSAAHYCVGSNVLPPPAQINFEPASGIHWAIRRRRTNVPKISGAIPSGNVHAAAECDG